MCISASNLFSPQFYFLRVFLYIRNTYFQDHLFFPFTFIKGRSKNPAASKAQNLFDHNSQYSTNIPRSSCFQMFSNCLVSSLSTSIFWILEHSRRRHSLLQGLLGYVMRTFEVANPKVSISLRCPKQKNSFSLFLQWIV